MDLGPHVASIEDSLLAAAAAGDDGTRRTAAALSAALEPAVRLAIMNALAETAVDITDALGDRVVEVRLDGGDVRIVVSPLTDVDGEAFEEATQLSDASGVLSRVTLRLPDELKIEAERAAAVHGVSLNTWLARAVREAVRGELTGPRKQQGQHEGTHRLRGWVQG
jgi:HicB-like protein involved in pilus formation